MCIGVSLSRSATPRAPSAAPARCDGNAGAYSATDGGPMQDMSPPQRVAFRHPRRGVFLARCKAAAFRKRGPWGRTPSVTVGHVPLGGLRLGDITAAPPETVAAGLLDLEPSRSPSRRRPSARGRQMGPSTSRRCETTAYCSPGARSADTSRRGHAASFLRSNSTNAERWAPPAAERDPHRVENGLTAMTCSRHAAGKRRNRVIGIFGPI